MLMSVKKSHFVTIKEQNLYDPNDNSYVMRAIGKLKRKEFVDILYKMRHF